MPSTLGAPRQLLRRLREVMAARESVQERLDKVVILIAGNMVAEVSSLYLLRRDGSLELFATEGLNREAVHNTHLKPGEGLVARESSAGILVARGGGVGNSSDEELPVPVEGVLRAGYVVLELVVPPAVVA